MNIYIALKTSLRFNYKAWMLVSLLSSHIFCRILVKVVCVHYLCIYLSKYLQFLKNIYEGPLKMNIVYNIYMIIISSCIKLVHWPLFDTLQLHGMHGRFKGKTITATNIWFFYVYVDLYISGDHPTSWKFQISFCIVNHPPPPTNRLRTPPGKHSYPSDPSVHFILYL